MRSIVYGETVTVGVTKAVWVDFLVQPTMEKKGDPQAALFCVRINLDQKNCAALTALDEFGGGASTWAYDRSSAISDPGCNISGLQPS